MPAQTTMFLFLAEPTAFKEVNGDFDGQDFLAVLLAEKDYEAISPTIETIQSGDWNDPAIWSRGEIPGKGDIIRINVGHTVLFNPPDEEEWSEDTEDICNSGMISRIKEGNKINALLNFGTLENEPEKDIKISASDFIYNNGMILGADAPDDTTTPDVPGRNVILTARNFHNGPEGNIQGGRGGDHTIYIDDLDSDDGIAVGGDGGSVEIYGHKIVNEGKIGPECDSPDAGGHGGTATTSFGEGTQCHDSFGGNGGNAILLADQTLINTETGRIYAGKGGDAAYGHCNGYPGKGGDIVFSSHVAIQNGTIQGCGKGSAVSCDPDNTIAWNGKGIAPDMEINISGGDGWILNLSGISADTLLAKTITLAVGKCGVVDLRGVDKGAIKADRVDIYADTVIKDDCVNLSELFGAQVFFHPSRIMYDFIMNVPIRQIRGTADQFAFIPVFLLNNSPEADRYEIKVKDSKSRELNVLDNHIVSVGSFKYKCFCLKVRLPDDMGEHDRLVVEAVSEGNPGLTRSAKLVAFSKAPPPESPDSDEDGLTDAEEEEIGTDPNNSDTDGDGMKDGWEYRRGLDPLKQGDDASEDWDGDGFTNFEEYNAFTNPKDKCSRPDSNRPIDTDGDDLPDIIESILKTKSDHPDTDEDGMDDCWEVYHELNPLEDDAESDPDEDGFTNLEEYNGGSDPSVPDSVPEEYYNDGDPEDFDDDKMEDGWEVYYELKSGENDADEDLDGDTFTNLEEFKAGSKPNDSKSVPDSHWTKDSDKNGLPDVIEEIYKDEDSDSDGMDDIWEVYNGLDPNVDDSDNDPDGDGFTNFDEYEAGTDPHSDTTEEYPKDTDKDGLPDAVEAKLGTSPTNADSDGDGMIDTWEIYNRLNPLDPKDASKDSDMDGFSNLKEHNARTYPDDPDSMSDEYPKDSDDDGLPDVLEVEGVCGTDPDNPDSDGDGMKDGWEFYNGLNPNMDEAGEDPDQDGLTNLEEFHAGTLPHCLTFETGDFIVGDDGVVKIDWLYDGGAFEGEFGIFSLRGMESLTRDDFIKEAIRRVKSDTNYGRIVFKDWEEGSRFRGLFEEQEEEQQEWNHGVYNGTQRLRMYPRDHVATILIPDWTFEEVSEFEKMPVGENWLKGDKHKSPLFSLVFANSDYGMHLGQMADISGMGNAFVYEDIDLNAPDSDQDYNDLIVQITGVMVVNPVPSLDSLTGVDDSGKRSRKKRDDDNDDDDDDDDDDDNNWFDWRKESELGRLIMEHIGIPVLQPEVQWISIEISGGADILLYDSEGRVIGKEGGYIPGTRFEIGKNGRQIISLPTLEQGEYDYRIVLHGTESGSRQLTIKKHQGTGEVWSEMTDVTVGAHQVFKSDILISSSDDDLNIDIGELISLYYDFDGDGDIDDDDIEKISSIWHACEGDQDYDFFYDFDEDGCITVLDIMAIVNNKTAQ